MRAKPLFRWFAALAVLAFLAGACTTGDDDDDTSSGDDPTGQDDGGDDGGDAPEPEPGPGFDGETITLGVLTPTTGPAAAIGEPLTNGNRVFWEQYNAENGGVAGKYPVELLIEDTGYVPDTAVQKYGQTHDDVLAYQQILGTQVTLSVLEQLKSDGIVAGPASLDSLWLSEENLLPVGAPYQYQFINAFDWYFAEDGDGNSIEDATVCALGQDDAYGEAGIEGLTFAAENVGFEIAETQAFPANAADFSAQVSALKSAGCTVVALSSLPSHTGTIAGTAATLDFAPDWIGLSPTWINVLALSEIAPYLEANFHVVSDAPDWGDESVPGMVEMLEAKDQYAPDQGPDGYFIFGYYQAKAMAALLETAVETGNLSQSGLIDAMAEMGTVDFGGLTGEFTYGTVDERTPPINSNIAAVVPDAPNGLKKEAAWTADYAGDFVFGE